MTLATWLLFCLTETALCMIPGPAVLLVLSTALRRGFPSATGIAAVIVASHGVFSALKWAGAAYLVWLGLRMLLAHADGHAGAAQRPAANAERIFVRAFIVQAANPKALVFFIALLPQFINPAGSVPQQILLLGLSSVVIEFIVLSTYAVLVAGARTFAVTRFSGLLERIGGAILIAAGARLAWYRID
jgi:homoserine/homoserine lactone efflux protein